MTTREALIEASHRGVTLTYWELRGMIERGEVARPRLNSALQWDWTPGEVDRLCEAASSRPKKAEVPA